MKYKGRLITPFLVLIINSTYIGYYFVQDGHIAIVEIIGLPVMLTLAWWFGKQYDQVKYLAEKDVLTDIYNRRFVLQMFPKLLALMNRRNESMVLFVIDVNDFKDINDTYGHEAGDRVLQAISETLTNSIRKSDIVVRWGGDEFIIIAPYADKMAAQTIMKRIEAGLEAKSENLQIDVTATIGLAVYPKEAQTLDNLLKVADKRMYRFKPNSHKPRLL